MAAGLAGKLCSSVEHLRHMWRGVEKRIPRHLASKGGALTLLAGRWPRALFGNWPWLILAVICGAVAGFIGGYLTNGDGLKQKREALQQKEALLDTAVDVAAEK